MLAEKLRDQISRIENANRGGDEVPAKSGFDIEVADGICEYVCSFLD